MSDTPLHPIFRNVPDAQQPVWRYLSFAKLAAMLQSQHLHFTRLDRFNDHFEGVWPRADLVAWNRVSTLPAGMTEEMRRSRVAASCWIGLSGESAGMWRLYAPGSDGVAVKTTFAKLQAATARMEATAPGLLAGAARVQYVDHATEGLLGQLKAGESYPNVLLPFMLKHASYRHEDEVRALVVSPMTHEIDEGGCGVEITSLADFIDEIVINPFSEPWFERTVEQLSGAHGVTSVRISSLHRRAFWQTAVAPVGRRSS